MGLPTIPCPPPLPERLSLPPSSLTLDTLPFTELIKSITPPAPTLSHDTSLHLLSTSVQQACPLRSITSLNPRTTATTPPTIPMIIPVLLLEGATVVTTAAASV